MRRELLIAAGPGEWRAALCEDGRAVELYVERGGRAEIGSVYLGRVRRLVPALGAALIDIGINGDGDGERLAFLPFGEMLRSGSRLGEGARAIVQVRREAQGGKAARLTMRVLLSGRRVELRAGRPGIESAAQISSEERTALCAALPSDGEIVVGLRILDPGPTDILVAEAADLNRRWRDILARAAREAPPCRLDPLHNRAGALAAALPAPPARVLVDDRAVVPELRSAFPAADLADLPETEWPIDLDAAFDRALASTIPLDRGALHIEPTRAAVLMDVDSGSPEAGSPARTALSVNLAAASAIAEEIRRRNLGGGIVVDFVGLDSRAAREQVRAALAAALAADPAGPRILGWTRLGHLELVRPRRGRPLLEALMEVRPGGALVKSALTTAYEALRAVRRADRLEPGRRWRLVVAPEVAAVLAAGAKPALDALERRFARPVAIAAETGRARERFDIVAQ